MSTYTPTPRTHLERRPARGSYDRALVAQILDEALVCHVGFVDGGQPYVLPTTYARVDQELYVHGAANNRMLKAMEADVCVTVTLLDGLVLARSAFHHSMNYRSVVILGRAALVSDPKEKERALAAIVEHVMPGRMREARPPSEQEIRATRVLRLGLGEVSAKVRSGPPIDDAEDLAARCWAGVLPLALRAAPFVADANLPEGLAAPRVPERFI